MTLIGKEELSYHIRVRADTNKLFETCWNFVPGCFFCWGGGKDPFPSWSDFFWLQGKVRLRNQPSNLGLTSWVNEKRPWEVVTSAPSQCEDVLRIGRPSWSSKKGSMGSVTNQKLASFGCQIYDKCTRHHYTLDVFGYGSVENQGSFSSFWWSPRGLQMVHLKHWSPRGVLRAKQLLRALKFEGHIQVWWITVGTNISR